MVRFEFEGEALARAIQTFKNQIAARLPDYAENVLLQWQGLGQGRIFGEHPRSPGQDGLVNRSGNLRQSGLGYQVRGTGFSTVGEGQIRLRYGLAQEFGATIRPKNAKMLAIPLDAAMDPSGVARYSPADIREESFIRRTKRGDSNQAIIFWKRGNNEDDAVPMFLLVRRVVIPPRWGLRDLWLSEQVRAIRIAALSAVVNASLREARKGAA
jgi:hypothetical protein